MVFRPPGTAKFTDTDHGQYDGGTAWDHAVGPMQFIPSTWAQAGASV
jgi:membrane-bound lytic murein transglycosylase B